MSHAQQHVPLLTVFYWYFTTIGLLFLPFYVFVAFYAYVVEAIKTRSMFHTRVRLGPPLAAFIAGPDVALHHFQLPKDVASGLVTVQDTGLFLLIVYGFGVYGFGIFLPWRWRHIASTPRDTPFAVRHLKRVGFDRIKAAADDATPPTGHLEHI